MSIALAFGRFLAESATAPLPDEVLHHAARALVDWSGAMIAGWSLPVMGPVRAAVADDLGHGRSTVYGTPQDKVPARTAALLNGTASHAIELDDIYAPGLYHPGCPTIAAALAVAEAEGATGAELLRAIVLGYEVGNRIAEAVQPDHYRYWHTTGTVGCMGAAAAAASLLKLDAQKCAHALSAATTFASGLQQAFRSEAMLKPLHAGRAAEAGVFAANAARHGLTGEPEIFEGPAGFGAAMSHDVDWDRAVAALGQDWTICRMTQKIHACCGHTFAAVDAALALRSQIDDLAAVRRIEVETYPVAIDVAGNAAPTTPYEAKFSIAFCVATALAHGQVGTEAFTDERVAEQPLRRLMDKVEAKGSERFREAFPAMRGAEIALHLADGRVLRHHQPTRVGSPQYPSTDADLSAKFRTLAGPTFGERTDTVLAGLWAMAGGAQARLPG